MINKFKVGDRIRYIGKSIESSYSHPCYQIGEITTVTGLEIYDDSFDKPKIKVPDDSAEWFLEEDFELVDYVTSGVDSNEQLLLLTL